MNLQERGGQMKHDGGQLRRVASWTQDTEHGSQQVGSQSSEWMKDEEGRIEWTG